MATLRQRVQAQRKKQVLMLAGDAPLPRFELGQTVITPGALAKMTATQEGAIPFLVRHAHGVWGDVCEEDAQANEEAVAHGSRILSSYKLKDGTKIWVITEADRSSTCILLPEEY